MVVEAPLVPDRNDKTLGIYPSSRLQTLDTRIRSNTANCHNESCSSPRKKRFQLLNMSCSSKPCCIPFAWQSSHNMMAYRSTNQPDEVWRVSALVLKLSNSQLLPLKTTRWVWYQASSVCKTSGTKKAFVWSGPERPRKTHGFSFHYQGKLFRLYQHRTLTSGHYHSTAAKASHRRAHSVGSSWLERAQNTLQSLPVRGWSGDQASDGHSLQKAVWRWRSASFYWTTKTRGIPYHLRRLFHENKTRKICT